MGREVSDTGIEIMARVCHEAIRAYKKATGEDGLRSWEEAPDWQKAASRAGVEFRLANPDAEPGAQHEAWMAEKREAGWVRGEIKDDKARTHPMMVPFEDLPDSEKAKDRLMMAVIDALRPRQK